VLLSVSEMGQGMTFERAGVVSSYDVAATEAHDREAVVLSKPLRHCSQAVCACAVRPWPDVLMNVQDGGCEAMAPLPFGLRRWPSIVGVLLSRASVGVFDSNTMFSDLLARSKLLKDPSCSSVSSWSREAVRLRRLTPGEVAPAKR
jgi:hypothetical protein